jgi:hypothetical protein
LEEIAMNVNGYHYPDDTDPATIELDSIEADEIDLEKITAAAETE